MKALENIFVIELAGVLAGPSVGQFLAECGATVLKIENPDTNGDVTRSWKTSNEDKNETRTAYFLAINWGKKTQLLDLKNTEDTFLLHSLLKKADIVLMSYKPGDQEKMGLDDSFLSTLNPRLIRAHISGYGKHNQRVGYDAILQAETGYMYLNREPNQVPTKMPVALMDVLAGHQLKEAILLALLERVQTNEGCRIDVSLEDSAIASLMNQATNYLNTNSIPQPLGSSHPNIVPYGTVFESKDGKQFLFAIGTDKQFRSLCEILQREDLGTNDLYLTNAERVKNRSTLLLEIHRACSLFSLSYLEEMCLKKNIPMGPVRSMDEVFSTESAQELILTHKEAEKIYKGVRNFIARYNGAFVREEILPPPPYPTL